jgi:hydrogenase maturation protein HypF
MDRLRVGQRDGSGPTLLAPGQRAHAIQIRVRGRVQGVGFGPAVWTLARELGVVGEVLNDGDGVLIRAAGDPDALAALVARIECDPPPLARVEAIETRPYIGCLTDRFRIAASEPGTDWTQIAPDVAICDACAADVADPFSRRYRYPFTACSQCGPRLTIATGAPHDRQATTLAGFPLCAACAAECNDPADRRFHAETTACPACGPRVRLVRYGDRPVGSDPFSMVDDVDAVPGLIARGEIVAIKGLGGYQLACDATRPEVVAKLRAAKHRGRKPFALMARSLEVIRRYCTPSPLEAAALVCPAAPIVVLAATGPRTLPADVAPGLSSLGFMLPATPLHRLVLRGFDRPVVMTSGNSADQPQAIDDRDAARRLTGIASHALIHDRPIASRVDDSVVRVADGRVRVVRRARGYAPAPIPLPPGFDHALPTVAYGGDQSSAFCLVCRGGAILSQHQGDLEDAATLGDYQRNLAHYTQLFEHAPAAIALDRHPGYHAGRLARAHARAAQLPMVEVQHHHAHLAACLVDNARALGAPPVLGIVLDGLGLGDDGALWGGEFLLADYRRAERLATFKPVAMLGGDRASREPWRNLYAHLVSALGWPAFTDRFGTLAIHRQLAAKPRVALDAMLAHQVAAPEASSCGRLFDAVAAALGICFEYQDYGGEAAARLEAAVDPRALDEDEQRAYPFSWPRLAGTGLPYLEPLAMWLALLGDLIRGTPVGVIAARFHRGLARAIAQIARQLARAGGALAFDTVALSGGCFQNRVLFEHCATRLRAEGFTVLGHVRVPTNGGGLALGQAAVCAAQLEPRQGGS